MPADKETLNEAYPIIEKIATCRRNNDAFAYYENKDIYQEVWCMCLEALDKYDASIGPIENYLNRHVSNRLKNLKRDKYFRPGCDLPTSGYARERMNLVNALPLDGGDVVEQGEVLCATPIGADPVNHLLCQETLEYVRSRLSEKFQIVLDDLINNNKIRKPIVAELRALIAEILVERDNDARR